MQGLKRRIVHALLFEASALLLVVPLAVWILDDSAMHLGILTVMLSLIAVGWNMIFNQWFESWEADQDDHRRTLLRRIAHAAGFEGGLLVITLPLIALWMDMSLWQALLTDIGFSIFYLAFGFVYNFIFDAVFGLPKLTKPLSH